MNKICEIKNLTISHFQKGPILKAHEVASSESLSVSVSNVKPFYIEQWSQGSLKNLHLKTSKIVYSKKRRLKLWKSNNAIAKVCLFVLGDIKRVLLEFRHALFCLLQPPIGTDLLVNTTLRRIQKYPAKYCMFKLNGQHLSNSFGPSSQWFQYPGLAMAVCVLAMTEAIPKTNPNKLFSLSCIAEKV